MGPAGPKALQRPVRTAPTGIARCAAGQALSGSQATGGADAFDTRAVWSTVHTRLAGRTKECMCERTSSVGDRANYSSSVRLSSINILTVSTHSSSGLLRQPCSDQDALRSRLWRRLPAVVRNAGRCLCFLCILCCRCCTPRYAHGSGPLLQLLGRQPLQTREQIERCNL